MRFEPKLTLKTPPGAEPVLPAALAEWNGASASDPLLLTMLKSAREMVESYLGAGIITQTWQQYYDINTLNEKWWDGVQEGPTTDIIQLPRYFPFSKWPIASVTTINFYDELDAAALVPVASYYVDKFTRPPKAVLRDGYTWPSVVYRVRDAAIAEYIVGYGVDGSFVPEALKNGIKSLAAYLYEHRGACDVDEAMIKSGARDYLKPFKVTKI